MTVYNMKEYDIFKFNRAKYQDYTQEELTFFIQEAQNLLKDICWEVFDCRPVQMLSNEAIYERILKINKSCEKSDAILKHWETLQKHLEGNPTLKEEWDSFMMAIKLTEDFE